jgi:hypothetical protein
LTEKYIAYTLVDITNSKNTNSRSTNTQEYNQQQNLNTFIQLIGLRSQPLEYSVKKLEAQDLVEYHFGNQFKGLHTVWKFYFEVEHSKIYEQDNDPVHFLKSDFEGVAFTPYLNETVNFLTSTFETKNVELVNVYFNKIES